MTSGILIRDATLLDAAAIAGVHITARQETYRGLLPDSRLDAERENIKEREAWWESILAKPTSLVSVALVDGEICGVVSGGRTSNTIHLPGSEESSVEIGEENQGIDKKETEVSKEKGKHFDGEIFAIYLIHSMKGRGIGRLMMSTMAGRLRGEGCESTIVWALELNVGARDFYRHLGGIEVGRKMMIVGDAGLNIVLEEVAYGWVDVEKLVGERVVEYQEAALTHGQK